MTKSPPVPRPERELVLVVDDAPPSREVIRRILTRAGFRVLVHESAASAAQLLAEQPVDLVVVRLDLAGAGGLELVRHVRDNLPDTVVMTVTAHASVAGAVEAVKAGAEEYLVSPFTDDSLGAAVTRALGNLLRRRAARTPPPAVRIPFGLVGESEAMAGVRRAITKAATTSATVLVTGESGTGKELVARAIHYSSRRAAAPFVAVNCGAIPEGLLESELFGHIRGAFTGATDSRAGFFQTADGGTIFLDEVSETSPAMQVKLMRVLQDKEVCMVGTTAPRRVDVRIVAATNRDPLSLVEKGVLREDLFYRLNVITIAIPPLRERGDDVLLLARHFAGQFAREFGKPAPQFSDRALTALREYYWPGNVRELENVIQRLVVMNDGEVVEVFDLPALMRRATPRDLGLNRTLADVEAEHVRNVLASCGDNRSRAARILGIDRKTLREKIK